LIRKTIIRTGFSKPDGYNKENSRKAAAAGMLQGENMEPGKILEQQQIFFAQGSTLPVEFRKQQLRLFKMKLKKHENALLQALQQDLNKSAGEAYTTEIALVYREIDWQLRHLEKLARARLHIPSLLQMPSIAKTAPVPYGNVLILSPWNYPVNLCLIPLVDALAAGNTAIVKPGNYAANTSEAIADLIADSFEPCYVACFTGGREVISELLDLPFQYIFFTGGKKVGQIVMKKAAAHLTPLTLELGGKSPAVVDKSANLKLAARRIVFGKLLNAGQTCVAPDYVYVHEDVKEDFLKLLVHEFKRQLPDPDAIGKIINEANYQRVKSYINPDQVVCGGFVSDETRQIQPTVLDNVTWQDPVMQEEIFGPVLPVLTFSSFREVMQTIQSHPTPLAFYLFSRNRLQQEYYTYVQPFGGGCINDTIVQLAGESIPFGGMGASGMGRYHGRYGFETFSHTKGIVHAANIDIPVRYANRPGWMNALLSKVL
jgi:aldehyde dehydrogenase (NAD+)